MQRITRYGLLAAGLIGLAPLAAAQHPGAQHHGAQQHGARHHGAHDQPDKTAPPTRHAPYAGLQQRDIKALSEQQIADLRAGRGMSMALPAELNGYPGPAHALELAEPLRLSSEQRSKTEALFARMQEEAQALGEDVFAAERDLDRLFKTRRVEPESLTTATSRAANAHGRLRASHLRYHLAMMEVLSPEQVARYNQLRGY